MEPCPAFCVTCFLPCNEKDDQVGVEPERIIPLQLGKTGRFVLYCRLVVIRMQATSGHCPLLVPADAEWRCLNPDAI